MIDDGIAEHPIEPGDYRILAGQPLRAIQRPHERILEDVLGIVGIWLGAPKITIRMIDTPITCTQIVVATRR